MEKNRLLFFRFFLKIIRQHLGVHLLIPLFVTGIIWGTSELLSAIWVSRSIAWAVLHDEFSRRTHSDLMHLALELVSVYVVFLLVVWISVWQSSDVRWAAIGILEDNLPKATRYFGIGTIPLREWFEPNTQVYLDTIVKFQIDRRIRQLSDSKVPDLKHDRALLFQTGNDIRAVQASYLDEHYAKSFTGIHERFEIPLAYLEPQHIKDVLAQVKKKLPASILHYPWFAPHAFWDWLKLAGIPRLRPFALIEKPDGNLIMLFTKNGNVLTISELKGKMEIEVCEEIADLITRKIYDEQGHLKSEFNFGKFLRP